MNRFLALLLATTIQGCVDRPDQADIPEVAERHAHRFRGECSSWLYSYKTGFKYCASPELQLPLVAMAPPAAGGGGLDAPPADAPVTMEALMARGEAVYGNVCAACHQANGQGVPGAFPPLAGSGEFYGDAAKMAGIIVKGLSGEIVVQGVTYNGIMPPQGNLSDYDIAAAATFVRNSWGNADGMVTPDDVKAVR